MHKILLVCILSVSSCLQAIKPWTACYIKKYTEHALQNPEQAFEKTDIAPFTQLVFSCNVFKPLQDGFNFFVRIRYTDTHQWSDWHRMFEWGQNGAKSCYGRHKDGLEQCYVRLEIPKKHYADGFQIKVETTADADLSLIKKLTVSVSDFTSFTAEKKDDYATLSSVHISDVPGVSQHLVGHAAGPDICSPIALCNLARYVTGVPLEYLSFVDTVFDPSLEIYGSWCCNIVNAFHATEGKAFFHVQRLHDFKSLHDYLVQGRPVVAGVRGTLTGAPKSYPGGHLMLVVGFDAQEKKVICHDSAVWKSDEVVKYYDLSEFLKAWEGSHRLAYIAESNA